MVSAILLAGGACSDPSEPDALATTAPASTGTSLVAPATAANTTVAAPPGESMILRPYVDPSICTPVRAMEQPRAPFDSQPFGMTYEVPPPVQAFADPALGAAGPFAVVLRIQHPTRELVREPTTTMDGLPARVTVYANGNGEAAWALMDGSVGYLRARDLDDGAIVDVLSRLQPRPWDAPIPGFDGGPSTSDTSLALVAEHPAGGLLAEGASLVCEVAGHEFWITSLRGEPIAQYLSVIDNHRPLAVEPNGDGVLRIMGPPSIPGAPTIADIREADPDTWTRLLDTGNG
jgi:hypothetical protein